MKDFFKLKKNGTTALTELRAGLITFMTMSYIIALNPNLLTNFGAEGMELWNGVFLATCIASAVGTICMGLLANLPFAMAPGMGLNTFFAAVTANIAAMTGFTYLKSFQTMLVIVLIEGIIFITLSLLNVREKIMKAIPPGIRLGIGPAIGLMLMEIGFGSNVSIFSENGGPFYAMRDFFGAVSAGAAYKQMGSGYNSMVLAVVTMFVGLFVIAVLSHKKVRGAILYGMLCGSAVWWIGEAAFLHSNPFESLKSASFVPPFTDMANTTLFKLDFSGIADLGFFTVITLVITFCIIDMFDTIGTLVGVASRSNMIDENGNMPHIKEALLSDAVGTVSGSLTGTSTVTTYAESASGVEAGGRTGLAAITTGILFFLCIFIAPIAAVIPPAATSSALIYVGILMLTNLKKIDFSDITQLLPVAIMLIAMPVSGSIGNAIGLALICYTVLKVCTGKAKDVSVLTYVLSAIFLFKFFAVF